MGKCVGEGAVLNFQNFATDLSNFGLNLKKCAASILIDTVDDGISQLMGRISIRAGEHVSNAVVRDRRRVRAYYPLLWVWHRLDQTRWTHSSIPMRTGRRRVTNLEVDHTVADAWWGRLVNQAIDAKLAGFAGTDEERSLVAPDNFESKLDALSFINSLGNCSLLEKTFNVSKSDEPMWNFLEQVHEFKEEKIQRHDWEIMPYHCPKRLRHRTRIKLRGYQECYSSEGWIDQKGFD